MKKVYTYALLPLGMVILAVGFIPNTSEAYVSVSGYTRSDGTYVAPYVRSNPNGLKYDNYGWTPSQGLYNSSYGTRGSYWDTPTYITDPDYYTGKSLYDSDRSTGYSSYGSYSGYSRNYEKVHGGHRSYGVLSCDSGYYESGDECEKAPAHSYTIGSSYYCESGYYKRSDRCVEEPDHGYTIGSTVYCYYGYVLRGSDCVEERSRSYGASNSWYSSYYGNSNSYNTEEIRHGYTKNGKTYCDTGYYADDGECLSRSDYCEDKYGEESYWKGDSCYYCSEGYEFDRPNKITAKCVPKDE